MPGDPNPKLPLRRTAIDGVLVQPLSWYTDQRGSLSVLLRSDQGELQGDSFGQAYVTTILPGVVKAWHRHRLQSDRMVGLAGETLLALVDGREGSPSHGTLVQEVLGERHPCMVLVPPGVWHGLKAMGLRESMLLNVPTLPWDPADPDEERLPPDQPPVAGNAPFCWERRDS